MKMNWEKLNFEHIGNFMHTTEYLALGKALSATLYIKVKMHITNLQRLHNLQKSSCLK